MRLLCFLMIATALLRGDIEDHLRKIEDKSDRHAFHNIDCVYLINLDERPEKLKLTLDQLTPHDIHPYRFSAVNGWKLSLETINDLGLKFSLEMDGGVMATSYHLNGNFEPSHELLQNYGQAYFCHCMSRGAIGIVMSHLSILQDAYDAGYETIWVMEDDVQVLKDPRVLPDLIDKLDQLVGKNNWDVLFTDRDIRDAEGHPKACYWGAKRPDIPSSYTNNFAQRTVTGEFCQIGSRWGAHSMILRRCGIKKLLQYFKAHQIFFPYDMDFIFPPGIKLFTVLEDIVSNDPKAASDNGGPNYAKDNL
jgi:GR25 family glycosyltransferase involved in LPS biosynthesis